MIYMHSGEQKCQNGPENQMISKLCLGNRKCFRQPANIFCFVLPWYVFDSKHNINQIVHRSHFLKFSVLSKFCFIRIMPLQATQSIMCLLWIMSPIYALHQVIAVLHSTCLIQNHFELYCKLSQDLFVKIRISLHGIGKWYHIYDSLLTFHKHQGTHCTKEIYNQILNLL